MGLTLLYAAGCGVTKGTVTRGPANTMGRRLLSSGFHTPKAVTYHEPTVIWLLMIGHSLGRMETCFGPSTHGWDQIGPKHIVDRDFAPF